MNVDELRWFTTLARTQHVTRAAVELRLSQPALSKAIARLERELGVALFERRGRGIALNRYGELLLRRVEPALAELDSARRELAEVTGAETGTVPLAFLATLGGWLVPELIRGFRVEHPGVRFRLSQGSAAGLLESLRGGGVDLVLLAPEPAGRDLGWQHLHTEALGLVVPAGHRLATRRAVERGIRLAAAADEPFVTLKPGYGMREIADAACAEAGFVPQIAFEGEEITTAWGLVSAGLGVALLPLTARQPDVAAATVVLPITSPVCERRVGLAWSAERYRSPAVEAFRRYVVTHAASMES